MTEALAGSFANDNARARTVKSERGSSTPTAAQGADGEADGAEIATACRNAAKRIVRQVRRSLHAHATESGHDVAPVNLWRRQPARARRVHRAERRRPGGADAVRRSWRCRASPMSRIASRRRWLALRATGSALPRSSTCKDVAFKGSYDHLKERVPSLAIGGLSLVAMVLIFAFAQVRMLRSKRTPRRRARRRERGHPRRAADRPGAVERKKARGATFVPDVTATAIFADIANAAAENVTRLRRDFAQHRG